MASDNESSYDESSTKAASSRKKTAPILRGIPPSRQKPSTVAPFYGMSGALLQAPNQSQDGARMTASSVEIINPHASLRPNLDDFWPRDDQSADRDEVTNNNGNTWTGEGLERAYRMQIQALSDPQTPESQRRTYEQKLLALAPILSGFVPGAINALQALAKTCSAKIQGQSISSRPLTPQMTKTARVRKGRSDKRRKHPQMDRGPRQMTNHTFF
jgi:hypothetical protein